ncbi:MAG: 4'-phosphopantetheinyl transferase superfamily protein [Oscillospiraceae bacterium]|nr:4'-phosphopantetheinyl transferase superfamily protein [Oscillospiraceae bacterium]
MNTLLSGYEKNTQILAFRVYAEQLDDSCRRQDHHKAHFAALDLLSAALAEDFGVHHAVIRREGLGKPKLIHDFLHMNLSHCKGLAVAAVGRVPVGVDAEAPRQVKDALMRKVCTEQELAAIAAADDKMLAFSRFWTLKEAYAKFTGKGIALDFSSLGFTLDPAPVFHHPAAESVQFYQILLENQHVVSLCVPRGAYTVKK